MVPSPDASTRERLIRCAEQVFARDGVAAASLREIARDSGTKNVTAIKYHFGDREGLLQAIHDKHLPAVEARRRALLDDYEARVAYYARHRTLGLRVLAASLVEPFADLLDSADGGPEYLRVRAALLVERSPRDDLHGTDPGGSMFRWRMLADPYLDAEAVRVHRRFTAMAVTINELARRAGVSTRSDHRLFVSSLVDAVTGILAQPSSPTTRALLAERSSEPVAREFGLRDSQPPRP